MLHMDRDDAGVVAVSCVCSMPICVASWSLGSLGRPWTFRCGLPHVVLLPGRWSARTLSWQGCSTVGLNYAGPGFPASTQPLGARGHAPSQSERYRTSHYHRAILLQFVRGIRLGMAAGWRRCMPWLWGTHGRAVLCLLGAWRFMNVPQTGGIFQLAKKFISVVL